MNMMIFHGPGGHGGGRGRRLGTAAAARVGLTDQANGTAAPPPPPPTPSGPAMTPAALWASAGTTWHGFRRVLGLVWDANPWLTLSLALFNLLQGGLPAARVWISKLLVDAVVAAVTTGSGTAALPEVLLLVVLQFAIGAASNILSTVSNICQQLLQEQVSNRIQMLVMRHANQLDLVFFERPQFYDLLQSVQREAAFRPVSMVQTAFGLIRQALTFLSLLALLVNLEWFIAVAALVSPIPAFVSSARYGWQGYQMMRWQSPLRRMMQYLTNLMTTDTYNKEVKLFTLGDFFVERFSKLFQRYYAEQRALVIRRYLAGAVWSMLTVLTSGLTFLYVAFRTLGGSISVGGLTLYVQAADGVSQAFSLLLGGLQSMYEHQLYLQTLFELLDFEPLVRAPEHPVPFRRPILQGIEFRNVTYTYEGKDEPALKNVSFSIGEAAGTAVRPPGGLGADRRTGCARVRPRRAAQRVRRALPGLRFVPVQRSREHRGRAHRAARRHAGDCRSGGQERRVIDHRAPAVGLRDGPGQVVRWRRQPEWRRVAEGCPGSSIHARGADPHPGRAVRGARRQSRVRAVHALAAAGARTDGHLHLTPLLDGASRGSHPGVRGGQPDRVRDASGAAGARRSLRGALQSPGRVLSVTRAGGARSSERSRT
ncbi:MAG: ABC transporter ATP-binding protein [Chloroflexi bacterium]|nr:MAG: ABC transporter ATP-binding protein [Chloroflexota bacterium]